MLRGMTKARKFLNDADSTLRPMAAPQVLVVGGPPLLVDTVRRVAGVESPAIEVAACELIDIASVAAQRRPFAIVVSQDVYAFDPSEMTALARDVQAELVVLKVNRVTEAFLEQALRPSLRHAFRRFRSVIESGPVRSG
jgi:hypothetical protein